MQPDTQAQPAAGAPGGAEQDGRPDRAEPERASALPNYTLSTVCPNCASPTYRLACKVRCDRCGFVWDCSEL